jgi:hypothetical protein
LLLRHRWQRGRNGDGQRAERTETRRAASHTHSRSLRRDPPSCIVDGRLPRSLERTRAGPAQVDER